MSKRITIAIASCALACLLLSSSALAQGTTGAVQGRVTDKNKGNKPLAGATVVVISTARGIQQTSFTGKDGSYKITSLLPGNYRVEFYYGDGTKPRLVRPNIRVSLNAVTTIVASIDTSAKASETVVVRGSVLVDPTKTTQGITLNQDYIKNIPVPGRTFASALGAAAGSAGDDMGVSFSGSTSLENRYVVDGVDTTGLAFGTVGSPLINEFIEETEIITGGYNAEYGRATGGVVNVVTKSGTNEFRGSVFSYVTPGFLIADTKRPEREASSIDFEVNTSYVADVGFELGGPIIKDKVWFYVGFAPQFAATDIEKITKRQTDCRVIEGQNQLSGCDPAANQDGQPDVNPETGFKLYEDLDRTNFSTQAASYQFVSKINFALAPEHQGQVSLIGTPATRESPGVRGDPAATGRDGANLTTDLSFKWTSKFNDNKTELEAVVGWHRATVRDDSIDDSANNLARENLFFGNLGTWSRLGFESMDTERGCTDGGPDDPYPLIDNCPDGDIETGTGAGGYALGGPGVITDRKEERVSARLGVTQRVNLLGNHEIKGGIDVEQNVYNTLRNYTGGVFIENLQGPFQQIETNRWVRLAPPDNPENFEDLCVDGQSYDCQWFESEVVESRTFNWSAFLRDSWQPLPNLTVNYGVRYEEQRLRYEQDLQNTTDPRSGAERGKNAMELTGMVAPRVGILYDWTKEGKSKIYGNYGRYFESIPLNINNRSFGGEAIYIQTFSADQCGANVDGYGGPSGTGCPQSRDGNEPGVSERIFGAGTLVAPGIGAQYLDELLFGVEYEVMEDLKVGVSYQHRWIGRVLEDVSVDNAATYILANPGEWSASEENALLGRIDAAEAEGNMDLADQLTSELEQYRAIRTFDRPRRNYDAVQLTAMRRFSRNFFMQGSYTYSRTRGNYPGLFSADNGQVDPNITSQFDLIELLANRDGPLPIDKPHFFKLDAYYVFDFKKAGELTLGGSVRALSGTPINALGRHYLYGFNESFLLPRGEMGRTGFDAGLDLRLIYARKIGKGMSLSVFADFFNIFNRQAAARRSSSYTPDSTNPIVGGEYSDLIWAKARENQSGNETPDPVRRNINFLNPTAYYAPFSGRLGARLTF